MIFSFRRDVLKIWLVVFRMDTLLLDGILADYAPLMHAVPAGNTIEWLGEHLGKPFGGCLGEKF